MAAANQGLSAPPENEDRDRSEIFGTRCQPLFVEFQLNHAQKPPPPPRQRLQIAAMPANTQAHSLVEIGVIFHPSMRVEFRNSGIWNHVSDLLCALGVEGLYSAYYLPTWNPTFA